MKHICLFLITAGLVSTTLAATPAMAQAVLAAKEGPMKFDKPSAYESGGAYADSIAVADLNGDGIPDLVVANDCQTTYQGDCDAFGSIAVLLGNGDGTFQPAVTYSTAAYYAYSVAIADLRGNGISDLVVANWCESVSAGFVCTNGSPGEVSVLLGNGDGTFQPAVTYKSGGLYAFSVAIGDLRRNGILDITVANGGSSGGNNGSVSVLLGNGDGTFLPAVSYSSDGYSADSVAIGDVSGNGIPDLVVANWCQYSGDCAGGGSTAVLLGNGDGTFQPAVTYNAGGGFTYSVAVGDLRNDGILDLVVANWAENGNGKPNAVGVMLGNGDGSFQTAVSYIAGGAGIDSVALGDVSGDGIPDLVVVDECQNVRPGAVCVGAGEVSVMLGNGDGTFQAPVVYRSGGYEGSSIAIADVKGDGRPDFIVTNAEASSGDYNNGSVAVLLNETSYSSKTALTSSPNPSQVNQSVTFTATITPTPPNGEVVTFSNGKTNLGTGATTNGVATLTTSFSKAATYTIKADYPGDPFRKPSHATTKQVVSP